MSSSSANRRSSGSRSSSNERRPSSSRRRLPDSKNDEATRNEAASPPPPPTTLEQQQQEQYTTTQVCEILRKEVHNMERALRCPICHSCVRQATMISVCCHAYCRDCLRRGLSAQPQQRASCPVCGRSCSHRSLVPATGLDALVKRFKRSAVALGLLPALPDARLALTQLLPTEEEDDDDDDASQQQSSSLADAHEQLRATRTFQRHAANAVWKDEHDALVHNAERNLMRATLTRRQQAQAVDSAIQKRVTVHDDETAAATTTTTEASRPDDDDRKMPAVPERDETAVAAPNDDDESPVDTDEAPTQDAVMRGAASEPSDETSQTEDPAGNDANTRVESESSKESTQTEDPAVRDTTMQNETPVRSTVSTTSRDEPRLAQPEEPLPPPFQPAPAAAAMTSSPTRTTQPIMGRPSFVVGEVVQVQARTWPGVNLPGGVGVVKAVQQNAQQVTYDVAYVLGGRERRVDAVFLSKTDLPQTGRRRSDQGAASRRLEQRQQQQEGSLLPPPLLAQLKSEGFDVEGKVPPEVVRAHKTPGRASHKKENRTTATTQRKRKTTTQAVEEGGKSKKRRRMGESTNLLARVASSVGRNKKVVAPAPVSLTDAQARQAADEAYRGRFQKAMQKSVISLAVSSLSDADMKRVETLCKQSKKIRIRVSNNLSRQTTLCIIPPDERDGTMARSRTAKAMRAALLGIPLVTPAWVDVCLSQGGGGDISAPTVYLRGLPTKPGDKAGGPCGIAHLAARSTGLLQNYQVHLCLPSKMQSDIAQLVKDARGTVTARLAPPSSGGQPLLLLCGDTDHNVGGAVQKAVTKNPAQYQVVHMRWLFDSISRGSLETDLSLYAPNSPKARTLWQLCCDGARV